MQLKMGAEYEFGARRRWYLFECHGSGKGEKVHDEQRQYMQTHSQNFADLRWPRIYIYTSHILPIVMLKFRHNAQFENFKMKLNFNACFYSMYTNVINFSWNVELPNIWKIKMLLQKICSLEANKKCPLHVMGNER